MAARGDSKIRVALPGSTAFKWLFPFRGPQRQVFVAGVVTGVPNERTLLDGVEVIAPYEAHIKGAFTLVLLYQLTAPLGGEDGEPGAVRATPTPRSGVDGAWWMVTMIAPAGFFPTHW